MTTGRKCAVQSALSTIPKWQCETNQIKCKQWNKDMRLVSEPLFPRVTAGSEYTYWKRMNNSGMGLPKHKFPTMQFTLPDERTTSLPPTSPVCCKLCLWAQTTRIQETDHNYFSYSTQLLSEPNKSIKLFSQPDSFSLFPCKLIWKQWSSSIIWCYLELVVQKASQSWVSEWERERERKAIRMMSCVESPQTPSSMSKAPTLNKIFYSGAPFCALKSCLSTPRREFLFYLALFIYCPLP